VVNTLEQRLKSLEAEKRQLLDRSTSERSPEVPTEATNFEGQESEVLSSRFSPHHVDMRRDSLDVNTQYHATPRRDHSRLPSNVQLLNQLPPTVLIPSPLEDTRGNIDPSPVSFDRRWLPENAGIDQLVNHFVQYTNAAFPTFHLPSLNATVIRIQAAQSTVASSDLVDVAREFGIPLRGRLIDVGRYSCHSMCLFAALFTSL
jgi:hypothetical protein